MSDEDKYLHEYDYLRESNAKLRKAVDWLQKASDVATTRYNQLFKITRTAISDEEALRLVRECVQNWGHPAENELASLRQKNQTLSETCDSLRATLRSVQDLAKEVFDYWDADNDMKVGKILKALAGKMPGYRVDTDRIVEAGKEPEVIELPTELS